MTRSHPLVSIVTPSFNQAKFLEETLTSVERQRYRPLQQIVIDGGSTDGTVELLQAWEARPHGADYSLEWLSEPDRGHADALNKGFARATGEVVGWLNSDDVYFDRQVVERAVSSLAQHPEVDLVFGDVALISETSGLQMIWCFPQFALARGLRGYFFSQPTAFFRRSVVAKHKLDPTLKLAPDTVLWLMMCRDSKFFHLGHIQAADRDHAGRQTHVNHAQLMQVRDQAFAQYGVDCRPNLLVKAKDQFMKLCMRFRGLLYLPRVCRRAQHGDDLAFPLWVDNPAKAVGRQLRMRIGARTDLGPRPALPAPFENC